MKKTTWEEEFDDIEVFFGTEPSILNLEKAEAKAVKLFISQAIQTAKEEERKETLDKLGNWIDGNIGVSSKAIFLWMSVGRIPGVFEAPSDNGDRGRCVVLLKARPEWIPRLKEIESLHLTGTSNGENVEPWNEQIPLIRASLINK